MALPVEIGGVPVERLLCCPLVEVDQVSATMAFAAAAAADNRAGDELDYVPPKPFLSVSQTVRGRHCARCCW
jgi:hypothetical protein